MTNEILTLKDLAIYLKCSTSTIRSLIRNKQIPHFRIGVKIYFRSSEIEKWIGENERL